MAVCSELLRHFYMHNQCPPWMIRMGMLAYDALSWDKTTTRRRILSQEETLGRFSGMDREDLHGAAV